jgi:hypothetical protein
MAAGVADHAWKLEELNRPARSRGARPCQAWRIPQDARAQGRGAGRRGAMRWLTNSGPGCNPGHPSSRASANVGQPITAIGGPAVRRRS